jgi:hypothetical protein
MRCHNNLKPPGIFKVVVKGCNFDRKELLEPNVFANENGVMLFSQVLGKCRFPCGHFPA